MMTDRMEELAREARDLAAYLLTVRGPQDVGTMKAQELAKKLTEHQRKAEQ